MTPSLAAIAVHFDKRGGLWLIIPAPTPQGQPRPLFACLSVATVGKSVTRTYEGGDLAYTVENTQLHGAEWLPVDTRGKPIT